jgi:hypothetical protein
MFRYSRDSRIQVAYAMTRHKMFGFRILAHRIWWSTPTVETHRSRVWMDADQLPVSCAVDPRTGDLAVANNTTTQKRAGSITIYAEAKGKGRQIPAFAQTKYVAYNGKGNLFVEGGTRLALGSTGRRDILYVAMLT